MLLLIPFGLGTASTLGIVETGIIPFIDMGNILLEFGGVGLSVGRIISMATLLAVFFRRDESVLSKLGVIETWIVYVTIGLIIAPPFFPVFAETFLAGFAGVFAFLTQSIGFSIVSYAN
jgi:hypothetical protein